MNKILLINGLVVMCNQHMQMDLISSPSIEHAHTRDWKEHVTCQSWQGFAQVDC